MAGDHEPVRSIAVGMALASSSIVAGWRPSVSARARAIPTMKFQSTMWHPNVYSDGRVCISILHNPGDDAMGYESAAERWTPVHTVTTILLSVLSMLSTPNDESPANVEAAIQWRNDIKGYNRKLQQLARKSMEEI